MKKCRECGEDTLEIIGEGIHGGVEVECQNPDCLTFYEVEPDGLGMAGEEWAIAKLKSMEVY